MTLTSVFVSQVVSLFMLAELPAGGSVLPQHAALCGAAAAAVQQLTNAHLLQLRSVKNISLLYTQRDVGNDCRSLQVRQCLSKQPTSRLLVFTEAATTSHVCGSDQVTLLNLATIAGICWPCAS